MAFYPDNERLSLTIALGVIAEFFPSAPLEPPIGWGRGKSEMFIKLDDGELFEIYIMFEAMYREDRLIVDTKTNGMPAGHLTVGDLRTAIRAALNHVQPGEHFIHVDIKQEKTTMETFVKENGTCQAKK